MTDEEHEEGTCVDCHETISYDDLHEPTDPELCHECERARFVGEIALLKARAEIHEARERTLIEAIGTANMRLQDTLLPDAKVQELLETASSILAQAYRDHGLMAARPLAMSHVLTDEDLAVMRQWHAGTAQNWQIVSIVERLLPDLKEKKSDG